MTAIDEAIRIAVAAAVAAERERCARIADKHARGGEYGDAACDIADEIRGLVTCEDCDEQRPVEQATCSKCADRAAWWWLEEKS